MSSHISEHAIVRDAIQELYGPCPIENFDLANQWSESIDWELVRDKVEETHPGFSWVDPNAKAAEPAEAMVFEVRSEMLEEAGRRSTE